MAAPPVIAATTLVSTTLSVYERVAQTTLALPCKLIPGPTRHVVPMPDQDPGTQWYAVSAGIALVQCGHLLGKR